MSLASNFSEDCKLTTRRQRLCGRIWRQLQRSTPIIIFGFQFDLVRLCKLATCRQRLCGRSNFDAKCSAVFLYSLMFGVELTYTFGVAARRSSSKPSSLPDHTRLSYFYLWWLSSAMRFPLWMDTFSHKRKVGIKSTPSPFLNALLCYSLQPQHQKFSESRDLL